MWFNFNLLQDNNSITDIFIIILPAINSVPAISAVAKKSSKVLRSVIDCKFNLAHS